MLLCIAGFVLALLLIIVVPNCFLNFSALLQVFISQALSLRVCKIFECIGRGMGKGYMLKRGERINYESLALGILPEVRQMFARIVFDTVYPPNLKRDNVKRDNT